MIPAPDLLAPADAAEVVAAIVLDQNSETRKDSDLDEPDYQTFAHTGTVFGSDRAGSVLVINKKSAVRLAVISADHDGRDVMLAKNITMDDLNRSVAEAFASEALETVNPS